MALFLLVSILPLALTGWITARWLGDVANETARSRASTILEIKKNRLEHYFSRYRADMEALTNGTQVLYNQRVQRLAVLRDLYGKAVQQQFQSWSHELELFAGIEQQAKNMATIDWVFRDGGEKITTERWPVLSANMAPSLNRFREKQGFDNLYFISAQGNVVLSALPDPLLGKNVGRGSLKECGLGKLFPHALGKSSAQGLAPCADLDNKLTAWMGTPIHKEGNAEGKIIGVLAARFSHTLLEKIPFTLEEGEKSVRLYLIGPDRRQYAGSDPNLTQEVLTAPGVLAALANEQGAGAQKGITGQAVFSAWAPIAMASFAAPQEAPWAVVAEQNMAHAFATDAKQAVPFYKKQMDQSGYYDFFLIQPDGEVFFSAARQADFGTNLIHGPYAATNFGKLFRQVLEKQSFALTDFEAYPPSNNEPAAFMAQPLLREGAVKMVVALQLPLETLTTLMQHRDGLEVDGDAYLVGPDKRLRSDSLRDPKQHSVLASFAGTVADNGVDSAAVQAALEGKTDLTVGQNWSGFPVFVAYSPLSWGGDTTWALLTEIPLIRGALPLHLLPRSVRWTAVGSLLFCLAVAWLAVSHLRRTLFQCVEPLQQMHGGKMTPSEVGKRTDEFGRVAREIQGVAERWRQVASRLRESGGLVVQTGAELSQWAQRELSARPQDALLTELDAGESATRECAGRLQQHLRQVQLLEQLLGRIQVTVVQGSDSLERAMTTAKEITEKMALFVETAQQTNQLSMRAAFEGAPVADGKSGKKSGTVMVEIRKLAEKGRIFADDISALSLGVADTVDNAHVLLSHTMAALQESAALLQGMAQADTAQHGQMVLIHTMTQEMKSRIQQQATVLHQWVPVAQTLAQQVAVLQKDLAFFDTGKAVASPVVAQEALADEEAWDERKE
ncbi:MAG: methyl-accepting chemotaxis protein [Magnetococcales bacterium]|nr:methyl-accepting chemotaxis protein [Magnetococcales bacterium]